MSTGKGRKYTRHDPEIIQAAFEAVRNGGTLRKTAKDYGIPYTTLYDKWTGRRSVQLPPGTLLTPEEEERIADHLIELESEGFEITNKKVLNLAKDILGQRVGKSKSDTLSKSWVSRFIERHPFLSKCINLSTKNERRLVTPSDVLSWFSDLEKHISSVDCNIIHDSTRIYCIDDSLFAFDVKTKSMVSRFGKKSVYTVSTYIKKQYWKKQVSLLACMGATGHFFPPLLIYPKWDAPSQTLLSEFPQALTQVSSNGWITTDIFNNWLKSCFIPSTANFVKPILLLMDGHIGHNLVTETKELCKMHGIILYCLYQQSSHLMHPLHQAFLSTFKQGWAEAKQRYLHDNGEVVSVKTYAGVIAPVWAKAATASNATDGFKTAGIYPFDPEKALSSDKFLHRGVDVTVIPMSSDVTDDVPETDSTPVKSSLIATVTDVQPVPSTSTSLATVTNVQLEPSTSLATVTNVLAETSTSLVTVTNVQLEPSTSLATVTNVQPGPSTSNMTSTVTNIMNESCSSISVEEQSTEVVSSQLQPPAEIDHAYFNSQQSSGESCSATFPIPSTSLAENEDLMDSSATLPSNDGPSSSASIPSCSNDSSSSTPDCSWLLALKNYAMFIYDEVSRNQFFSYFNKLSCPELCAEIECPSKFIRFEQLATTLFNRREGDNNEEKLNLSVDDILNIAKNLNKTKSKGKKKIKSTNETIEKLRAALMKKNNLKVASESNRLRRIAEREEMRKKKIEMRQEEKGKKIEMKQEEDRKKLKMIQEEERRRKEKIMIMRLRKEAKENERKKN